MPSPTPTPGRKPETYPQKKPWPTSWRIGAIAAALLATVAFLYRATRAWRRANIFARQYRFPAGGEAALRLGGMRSGGHMATIRFGEGEPPSKTEDA